MKMNMLLLHLNDPCLRLSVRLRSVSLCFLCLSIPTCLRFPLGRHSRLLLAKFLFFVYAASSYPYSMPIFQGGRIPSVVRVWLCTVVYTYLVYAGFSEGSMPHFVLAWWRLSLGLGHSLTS